MIPLLKDNWKLFILAALTIGLLPYDEPHIWGKLTWIAGGGAVVGEKPMEALDWLDFFLHGLPWLLLILSAAIHCYDFIRNKFQEEGTQSRAK